MEVKDIILIIVVLTALGLSIYRKYIRKSQPGKSSIRKGDSASAISSSKDDDYEPYSKR